MKSYADTSFLVSLYSSDANSARADGWRQANPAPLPFTLLHALEFRNALWQSAFQKTRTPADVREVLLEIEVDMAVGLLFTPTGSFDDIWMQACGIADTHTMTVGARSLDILHIAAAKWLKADEIATFDQRQASLALQTGLKVAVL